MTVSQLIDCLERARAAHGDLGVIVEGCDCYGEATGVSCYTDAEDDRDVRVRKDDGYPWIVVRRDSNETPDVPVDFLPKADAS